MLTPNVCRILGLALLVGSAELSEAQAPNKSPLWSFSADDDDTPAYGQNNNGKAAQFGMISGSQLYVSSYNGHVYQLDLASGALQADWPVSDYRAYSAPMMVDGKVYVFADRGFYRLEKAQTPRVVKLFEVPAPGTDRPEALAYDRATGLFFLSASERVHAVDADGNEKWRLPHFNYGWGQAMAAGGHLYVFDTRYPAPGYDLNQRKLYKYLPTQEGAQKIWESAPMPEIPFAYLSKGIDGDGDELIFLAGWQGEADRQGNPIDHGSLSAIYDRGLHAGQTKWSVKLPHTIKHASLWEGKDTLIVPAMNGKVRWLQASTGKLIREVTLTGGVSQGEKSPWQQVVISGHHGIVMTHDGGAGPDTPNHLFVLDLRDGRELWKSAPIRGGGGCMIPVLSGGIAVVGTYWQGTWHAFRLGEGKPFPFSGFANEASTGNAPGALTQLAR